MKLMVARPMLRTVLLWTQRLFFACAAVMLSYCAFVLGDSWLFQRRARQALDQQLSETKSATRPAEPEAIAPIGPDGLIGRIDIARIGLSAVVFEGTDKVTLRRAVGHVPYTALPGQRGNVGLAGHRDSFFRPLRNIVRDDIITVTTVRGAYRYRVASTRIVSPYEVEVLDPSKTEILTLVTCYPFYFVGSAPSRFIVRAERIA